MKLSSFEVLSQKEIQMIHAASLRVLENTGVRIQSNIVLGLLEEAGAKVDRTTRICKFPPQMVEDALAQVPETFDLYDRSGNKVMTIGDGTPYCASGHNAVFCMDVNTKERRYANVQDVEEFGIISQWCESIDIVGVPLNPMDVPPSSTLLHATKALFETTTKPLFLSTESCQVVESLIAMMKVVAGREDIGNCPNAIIQLSPSSPLFWDASVADGVVSACKARIPLVILPEPMSGVSAPYSVAGLLTEHNIELLSGVVISQLVSPGTPIMYGSSWTGYDMRFSNALIGTPETTLLRVAGCQMARFYHIPSHTTATNTDSNAHDEHHAWESVLSNMAAMNAQNDIVMNSGMFACGLTTSLEQLIMDNEMNLIVKRLMRGIEVTEESIAADSIMEVGPGGNFLMEDLTLENLYTDEFHQPTIRMNLNYESWMAAGAPTVDMVANKMAKDILEKGNAVPLDETICKTLSEIITAFEESSTK